jgi:hypothetical protein
VLPGGSSPRPPFSRFARRAVTGSAPSLSRLNVSRFARRTITESAPALSRLNFPQPILSWGTNEACKLWCFLRILPQTPVLASLGPLSLVLLHHCQPILSWGTNEASKLWCFLGDPTPDPRFSRFARRGVTGTAPSLSRLNIQV